MSAEYIVGEGPVIEAEDPKVHDLLMRFWEDPINDMPARLLPQVTELSLWGEQCYQAFVNEQNGFVRLGYIDPGDIKDVKLKESNIVLSETITLANDKVYPVINFDDNPNSPTYGYWDGRMFFFKINSVTKSSRGRSDIIATSDFFDIYSQFLFSRGERSTFGNAWMWDVTLEGLTMEQIKAWLKDHPPPSPGSVRAHNEKVKWTAVAPDLKAHDASFDGKMLKNYILGSCGFPEHFFGEGGDVNRATALEMNEPIVKRLNARQTFVINMFKRIFNFVIDQAILHRQLPGNINRKFKMYFPEISSKEMEKSGLTMMYLAQSLQIAVLAGWVENDEAAKLYAAIASLFGPEVKAARGKTPDFSKTNPYVGKADEKQKTVNQ